MQPHFTKPFELLPLADGRNFRLGHSFGFWSLKVGWVTAPEHFKTDLASIPRLFWNILPPFGKYSAAAVIHDFLYRTHAQPRAVADAVLLEAMEACKVSAWQRNVIYYAVRLFGWAAYADDSRRIRH